MPQTYQHVTRFVSDQVWAIREATLDIMVELLRMRSSGITLTEEEIQARIGAAARPGEYSGGTVAVLPLYGVISPKMSAMTAISGGTSLERFMGTFRAYLNNPSVSAIVADIDSPGGSVFGLQEAFDEIYKARAIKPAVAQVNPQAGSAALWIASAFKEIVATPSGEIGSLGVFAVHEDWSKANEMMGLKPTYISAGKYKVEGNPDEPLSDDARAYMQSRVDAVYADFLRAVAKGRGVDVATAKADFGQGRMLLAKEAMGVKLIDRIDTLEATISRLGGGTKSVIRPGSAAVETDAPVAADTVAPAEPHAVVHELQRAKTRMEIDERCR